MNLDVQRPSDVVIGGTAFAPDVLLQSTQRIQSGFLRPEQARANRELNLRTEERRRERERVARELHDLFQGFLGASLLLGNALEQIPAASPSKPLLSRVLCLMRRVIDEGRIVLQGIRSSMMAPTILEQGFTDLLGDFTPADGAR